MHELGWDKHVSGYVDSAPADEAVVFGMGQNREREIRATRSMRDTVTALGGRNPDPKLALEWAKKLGK